MTVQTPATIPYEVFQRERERRIQAERERDHWRNEFYLQRNIRRAPVLQPVTKAVLEECRHVEKWGTVKGPDGSTRANYTTIAHNLKTSPDTVARQAERLQKLGLIEIHEHQGPKDERDRKYIHVLEQRLSTLDQLTDPDKVIPKQGGNRYICPSCDSPHVEIRKVTTLHCLACDHEETIEDTDWVMQNGHKEQKQHAFKKSKHTQAMPSTEEEQPIEDQKQLGEHSVYTGGVDSPQVAQKQDAFTELQALPQWVCWRYGTKRDKNGKRDKKPFDAKLEAPRYACDYTDPLSWATYDQALAKYQESQSWKGAPYDGIGFCFKKGGGLVGIDFDLDQETGCFKSDLAQVGIALLDSYSEQSPNGGVKTFVHGAIKANVKRDGIEMYDHDRFFTWTGKHLADTPTTIEDRQEQIDALYAEIVPPKEATRAAPSCVYARGSCTDEEVLEKARHARNGAKFRALYDTGTIAGYASHSEADLALCRMLAHWTDDDASQIDRLFRGSKLYREKWERNIGAGETYGERTISRALGVQKREQLVS